MSRSPSSAVVSYETAPGETGANPGPVEFRRASYSNRYDHSGTLQVAMNTGLAARLLGLIFVGAFVLLAVACAKKADPLNVPALLRADFERRQAAVESASMS